MLYSPEVMTEHAETARKLIRLLNALCRIIREWIKAMPLVLKALLIMFL